VLSSPHFYCRHNILAAFPAQQLSFALSGDRRHIPPSHVVMANTPCSVLVEFHYPLSDPFVQTFIIDLGSILAIFLAAFASNITPRKQDAAETPLKVCKRRLVVIFCFRHSTWATLLATYAEAKRRRDFSPLARSRRDMGQQSIDDLRRVFFGLYRLLN
jgi:hypothetical protein